MKHIDGKKISEFIAQANQFAQKTPFPWACVQGFIKGPSFRMLCADLPQFSLFSPEINRRRGYGQSSHDRLVLQYNSKLDQHLPKIWVEFINDIQSPEYDAFLRAVYGLGQSVPIVLTMHWHFAPCGASVSPHVDASRKIGSHIFYFNTEDDWDPAWGGQTLVLDDKGKIAAHSSPKVEDLIQIAASEIIGNQSFIFRRTEHSWHAVNPIKSPAGRFRKVFIVVANRQNLQVVWRRIRGKDPDGYRI